LGCCCRSFTNSSLELVQQVSGCFYFAIIDREGADDMFAVTEYSAELMRDPFGILTGKRYEFILDLDVADDDELYHEEGVTLRVIYVIEEEATRIAKYEFLTTSSNKYIDFELEEDEEKMVLAFCQEHFEKAAE
jgi:uncharacterized protein (UPF0128 family)